MAEIRLIEGRLMVLVNKFEGQVLLYPVQRIVGIIAGQQMKIQHRDTWGQGVYFLYDEGVYDIWFDVKPEVHIKIHVQMTTGFHSKDTVDVLRYPPDVPVDYTDAPLRWERKDVL